MFTEKVISSKQFTKSIPKRKVGLGYTDEEVSFTRSKLAQNAVSVKRVLRKDPTYIKAYIDKIIAFVQKQRIKKKNQSS